jgi:hypothetical protein
MTLLSVILVLFILDELIEYQDTDLTPNPLKTQDPRSENPHKRMKRIVRLFLVIVGTTAFGGLLDPLNVHVIEPVGARGVVFPQQEQRQRTFGGGDAGGRGRGLGRGRGSTRGGQGPGLFGANSRDPASYQDEDEPQVFIGAFDKGPDMGSGVGVNKGRGSAGMQESPYLKAHREQCELRTSFSSVYIMRSLCLIGLEGLIRFRWAAGS